MKSNKTRDELVFLKHFHEFQCKSNPLPRFCRGFYNALMLIRRLCSFESKKERYLSVRERLANTKNLGCSVRPLSSKLASNYALMRFPLQAVLFFTTLT